MKNKFSLRDKLDQIAKKLVETKYDLEFGDRAESIKTITNPLNTMVEYTNIVATEAHRIMMAGLRANSPEEYRETVESIDRQRRNTHNSAIAGLNMLNRVCENELHIGKFADINTENREDVADFAATVAKQQAADFDTETEPEPVTMHEATAGETTVQKKSAERLGRLLDKYEDLLNASETEQLAEPAYA